MKDSIFAAIFVAGIFLFISGFATANESHSHGQRSQTYSYPFGGQQQSGQAVQSSGSGSRTSYRTITSGQSGQISGISGHRGSGQSSGHRSGSSGGRITSRYYANRQMSNNNGQLQREAAPVSGSEVRGSSQGTASRRSYIRRNNNGNNYRPMTGQSSTGFRSRSVQSSSQYGGAASGQRSQSGQVRSRSNNDRCCGNSETRRVVYRSVSGQSAAYTANNAQRNSQCFDTGVEVTIEGLSCSQAVSRFGTGLCYTHEYSSRGCCETCLPRRDSQKPGCEYGDRSTQCNNIRPGACYDYNNRQVCCQTCERLRTSDTPGCEYGDLSNRCDIVRQNPGLCYQAENRRLCCQTCDRFRNPSQPSCEWGDYDRRMCRPFEGNTTNVRINCYSNRIRNLCCDSCRRLREWVPNNVPQGCEYGDHPVTFIVNGRGNLRCSTYFNYFPTQHCSVPGSDVSRLCCYTCHRQLGRSNSRG